jgi:uncharacterized membrane protein
MIAVGGWFGALPDELALLLITFLPALELRASIPYGLLATPLPTWEVIAICILGNWLVAPVVYLIMRYLLRLLTRWGWFDRRWQHWSGGVERRAAASVKRWGMFGLVVFIAIPLPGSGVYSGGVAAYLLGIRFRHFIWLALAGVLIAGALVSAIVLSGSQAFDWMVKDIAP